VNIGNKIKTLRRELKMTQKELAGEEITRNMLSCIENGSSLPSISTLVYIAERLGVSPGFLIADENEDHIYRKSTELTKIRQAFARNDWKMCLRYCELQNPGDSETHRYELGCLYNLAKECFNCGELRQAGARFMQLRALCRSDFDRMYPDGFLCRVMYFESGIYLECLKDISPAFSQEGFVPDKDGREAISDPFTLYYLLYRPSGSRDQRAVDSIALNCFSTQKSDTSFYREHIHARTLMKTSNYREACNIIREIAYGEKIIPQPVLLFLLSDLEICFRELSDFRNAYECSGLHRELLDSFLSDKG